MKEKPILFNSEMIRAILGGTKSQTRRVVKDTGMYAIDASIHGAETASRELRSLATQCPFGQVGDRIWVRETWSTGVGMKTHVVSYRADGDHTKSSYSKWRPSIHMPRWASRISLEITGVRVERLQEISEGDAIAEGVQPHQCENFRYRHYQEFVRLWENLYGSHAWLESPWVWVVEFKRVEVQR